MCVCVCVCLFVCVCVCVCSLTCLSVAPSKVETLFSFYSDLKRVVCFGSGQVFLSVASTCWNFFFWGGKAILRKVSLPHGYVVDFHLNFFFFVPHGKLFVLNLGCFCFYCFRIWGGGGKYPPFLLRVRITSLSWVFDNHVFRSPMWGSVLKVKSRGRSCVAD